MEHIIRQLIDIALAEDIGPGDITTDYLIDPDARGEGYIIAKQDLVLAGCGLVEAVFGTLDPEIEIRMLFDEGDPVQAGQKIMEFSGSLASLLKGERTALNFLQRLSGIATNVRRYVEIGRAHV
jgi:nicotinate-nucleotide pyrophosphorylase (carboxylating)